MDLNLNKLTTKFQVIKLTEFHLTTILDLCNGNPIYYRHYNSEPTIESLRESLYALPPSKTMADKYFVGFFNDTELVAVLDLITGYPTKDTAYIGLFMIARDYQGNGLGTQLISDLITHLTDQGFCYVELGYIKGNAQAKSFWTKNDFTSLGGEIKTDEHTIIRMQCKIKE